MLLLLYVLLAGLVMLMLYVLAHVGLFGIYKLTGGKLSFRRWWKKMEI